MSPAERVQKDFSTITLALIPVAIVINIVVGDIVAALKLPLYMDSIGTMIVAVLAGPIAGAATGVLTNLIWSLLPAPVGSQYAWAFAGTAFFIGLLTGLFANLGWFKKVLPATKSVLLVVVVGGVLTILQTILAIQAMATPDWSAIVFLGPAIGLVLTIIAAFLAWRGTFPPLMVVGGVILGIVSAIISAPVAAIVFGGVTGAGTDLLVALFQGGGLSTLQANLAQGLVSDPFDKFVSYLVVWTILHNLSHRLVNQFSRSQNVAGG